MNPKKKEISLETLSELVRLEAATGKLYWRGRSPEHFSANRAGREWRCSSWNRQFAGKEAFSSKSGTGYLRGEMMGEHFLAHQVVFALTHGRFAEHEIDHINGQTDDNRPENLREVTCRQNSWNQSTPKNNTSGVMGVYWHKFGSQWAARIMVKGVRINLGYFKDREEAIDARKKAEIQYGFHPNHGRKRAVNWRKLEERAAA